MKKTIYHFSHFSVLLGALVLFSSCDLAERVEKKAASINRYENVSLSLAKENRELKTKISRLEYKLQKFKSRNNYLELKLKKKTKNEYSSQGREVASFAPPMKVEKDYVKWDVYKWSPEQLYSTARNHFKNEEFEKAAQFFHALVVHYPKSDKLDDKYHYQAGVASYESGNHPEWTLFHMEHLMKNNPTSKFYRGAKLWSALTHLEQGHEDKFFKTVEEFRKKYRNTPEWKILSGHYEEIVQKYK